MTPDSQSWERWSQWAAAEPQQAVLKALATVTDPDIRYAFGFPYGREGVSSQLRSAGLFVDLGVPPILARAHDDLEYLDRLRDVCVLCTVEATRRAEAGQSQECLDVLIDWLVLGRMVSDRIFAKEVEWGMTQMMAASERLRDVMYVYPDLFTPDQIADAVIELDLRSLRPERIKFPDGERLAAMQLVRLTIKERGGADPAKFPAILGRVDAGRRAMLAFSEAAKWAELLPDAGGWFEMQDEIDKVFGDWGHRWAINDNFDPLMDLPTDYTKMNPRRFALVGRMADGLEALFDLRMMLLVELMGTRSALGVVGYHIQQHTWPPTLAAVQPRFVKRLDRDPWSFDRKREIWNIFQYYVPIRDEPRGERELPRPHRIRVVFGSGETGLGGEAIDAFGTGPFDESTADVLRDALKGGIPERLWDREAQTIDVEGLKEFLKGQVRNLLIDRAVMDAIIAQIDVFDETTARTVIALVEGPEAAGLTEMRSEQFSEQDWQDVYDRYLQPTELLEQDPALLIKGLVRLWVENADEVRRRAQDSDSNIFTDGDVDIGTHPPSIIQDVFDIKTVTAENAAELNRRLVFEVFLSDEFTGAIRRLQALSAPTAEDIVKELKLGVRQSIERLLNAGGDVLAARVARVSLDDSQFVLYSVGKDGQRQMADRVGVEGMDILIWPPLLSLQR